MEYRPSLASFLGSLLYRLSPAATAGLVLYLSGPAARTLIWVLSALMGLFAVFLGLQTVLVHLNRLFIDETGVQVRGPLSDIRSRWEDIHHATLRERENAVSRTDHLLILMGPKIYLNYPTSILSPQDEASVLEEVRKRKKLVVLQDRPTV